MAFKIQTKITGMEEIQGKLKQLEKRGAEKIQRKAVTEWAKQVYKGAKARLVDRRKQARKISRAKKKGQTIEVLGTGGVGIHGQLKRSYGQDVKKKGSKIIGLVGARHGFKIQVGVRVRGRHKGQPIFHDPTKIDHLVEFGHGGPSPAPAYPHLRPARDQVGYKPIIEELTKGLVEECK